MQELTATRSWYELLRSELESETRKNKSLKDDVAAYEAKVSENFDNDHN